MRVRFAGILTDRIIVQSCSRNGRRSYSNSCGGRGAGSNTSNTLRATALRSSSMPASLGWRASSASGSTCPTGPARQKAGSRSKTRNTRRSCALKKRLNWRDNAMASSSETPSSFVYSAPDVNTDNPWSAMDLADLKLAINDSWTLSDAASYAGRKTRLGKRPRRWGLHSPGPRMGRLETLSSHRRELDAARELRKGLFGSDSTIL